MGRLNHINKNRELSRHNQYTHGSISDRISVPAFNSMSIMLPYSQTSLLSPAQIRAIKDEASFSIGQNIGVFPIARLCLSTDAFLRSTPACRQSIELLRGKFWRLMDPQKMETTVSSPKKGTLRWMRGGLANSQNVGRRCLYIFQALLNHY